ncbi:MAG: hypothetical protein GY854_34310 [Deltaproteobacteria bacterium]|nr:hypothetical protein [Deltaproteobacteria bacterium]
MANKKTTNKSTKKPSAKITKSDTGTQETAQQEPTESDLATMKPNSAGAGKDEIAFVASRIVHKAASILEEEIARGIVAAKEVEERYINIEEVRSKDPNDVINRFRDDAHQLIDIVVDLIHVTVHSLEKVVSVETNVHSLPPSTSSNGNGGRDIKSIELPGPVTAGEYSEASITLTNADDEPTPPFTFCTLGLVNAEGDKIPPECITFLPENLVIKPKGSAPLIVRVDTPKDISNGVYTGVLQSTHQEKLCATLSVEVTSDQ